MCGINGIIYTERSGRSVDPTILARMRDTLNHRGPDESGIYVESNVGLGHRRLSIVDLKNGQQPMFNEAKSCVITYNGEVYNHADLRPELVERGYKYKTNCDTETILHLYEEFGPECVHKLRGMFAFAIWNKLDRELFVARDRLGVKPLYYLHAEDGSFFFASEIKSILEVCGVRPVLNYDVLPDQLANHGTSGEDTLFKRIKRLPPGYVLVWKDGSVRTWEYWDISFDTKHANPNDSELVEKWSELFEESVKVRLMADVPLGMFLSGGIDSSAICALMSRMVDDSIKTFSVGFKEREANEFEYARVVSKAFKTEHREITITPDQFFAELPNLIWHEDEPLGFIASVPLYFVSKLAREHVKVVLTGEGSDETLAGYGRYAKALQLLAYGGKYESVTPSFFRKAVKAGVAVLPRALSSKLERTFLSRRSDVESLFFDNFAVFPKAMQVDLFSDDTKSQITEQDPYMHQKQLLAHTDADCVLDGLLYVDSKTYLHELLMKQDQMSMAASIESRVPFLDHKLVEFTAKLPVRLKLRGVTTKWILREAMKNVLPKEILERPKMGFPVPVGRWFRGEYKHIVNEFILSERALSRGIFNESFIRKIVDRHNSGESHDERLWSLVNFEIWQRRFFDGEIPMS